MTTDFKALCIELLKEWDNAPTPSDIIDTDAFGVIRKIRTALETEETMTENHPITPPPELVGRWIDDYLNEHPEGVNVEVLVISAARWGSDQELEACCEWMVRNYNYPEAANPLRAARRPKPPSLKEQALAAFEHILNHSSAELGADTVRRALEQLDD